MFDSYRCLSNARYAQFSLQTLCINGTYFLPRGASWQWL